MEKLQRPPPRPRRRPASSFEFLLGLALGIPILVSLSYLQQQWRTHKPAPLASSEPTHHAPPTDIMNPWPSILPSENLVFTPCYQPLHPSFLCARLSLPMDPSAALTPENKVDIALVLLPATVNTTAPAKPPLLINPGGPGGPGALAALLLAPALQVILGGDQPIIGFDPRGVGESRPLADCWAAKSCPLGEESGGRGSTGGCGLRRRLEWMGAQASYGTVASSGGANTGFLVQGERGVNRMCSARDNNTEGRGILRFAGTPFVAGDMLAIVDAWGRTVGEEGGKLVYWGFSYGTYLGQVFARMFPERVGRLVLDGVVDADLYETEVWMESLLDADKVVGWFFRTCVEARQECALYREGDGVEEVEGRYRGVVERLEREPVVFTHPMFEFPVVLREEVVRALMFVSLYSPIQRFPPLAELLNALHQEKWEAVAALYSDLEALCNPPVAMFPFNFLVPTDAQRAVMCADKVKPVNLTVSEIQRLYEKLSKYSGLADFWTQLTLVCNGWDIFPPRTNTSTQDSKQVKTNHPLLFMSMTLDPVTPLLAAVKMALKFEDAGLLEVKSVGHATISAASRCSAKIVRDYIVDGKLPPPPVVDGDDYLGGKWTTCKADEKPWRPLGSSQVVSGGPEDFREASVDEAWAKVRATLERMPRWGTDGNMARMVIKRTGWTPAMEDIFMGWKTGAGVGPMDVDELLRGF